MARKPVIKTSSAARSPLVTGRSPLPPAYVKKTKSNSGVILFLLLLVVGGVCWYVYNNYQNQLAAATQKPAQQQVVKKQVKKQASAAEESTPGKTALGTALPAEPKSKPQTKKKVEAVTEVEDELVLPEDDDMDDATLEYEEEEPTSAMGTTKKPVPADEQSLDIDTGSDPLNIGL